LFPNLDDLETSRTPTRGGKEEPKKETCALLVIHIFNVALYAMLSRKVPAVEGGDGVHMAI